MAHKVIFLILPKRRYLRTADRPLWLWELITFPVNTKVFFLWGFIRLNGIKNLITTAFVPIDNDTMHKSGINGVSLCNQRRTYRTFVNIDKQTLYICLLFQLLFIWKFKANHKTQNIETQILFCNYPIFKKSLKIFKIWSYTVVAKNVDSFWKFQVFQLYVFVEYINVHINTNVFTSNCREFSVEFNNL